MTRPAQLCVARFRGEEEAHDEREQEGERQALHRAPPDGYVNAQGVLSEGASARMSLFVSKRGQKPGPRSSTAPVVMFR